MKRTGSILLLLACLWGGSYACNEPGSVSPESLDEESPGETLPVSLYFPGEDGQLHAEPRNISAESSLEQRVGEVVNLLLEGPSGPALEAPFPEGVVLDSILINRRGVAYLDFRLDNTPRPPITGSRQELLAIYSVVDSVLINVTDLRSVVVLWNGQQRSSFAGHVDTSRPLVADTSYLVETP